MSVIERFLNGLEGFIDSLTGKKEQTPFEVQQQQPAEPAPEPTPAPAAVDDTPALIPLIDPLSPAATSQPETPAITQPAQQITEPTAPAINPAAPSQPEATQQAQPERQMVYAQNPKTGQTEAYRMNAGITNADVMQHANQDSIDKDGNSAFLDWVRANGTRV